MANHDPASGTFPEIRMRRPRMTAFSRALTKEHHLTVNDLIWPIFVTDGQGVTEAIDGLPAIKRYSPDVAATEAAEAQALGIPVIAIFPCINPALKDASGSNALAADNLVCQTIRAIKQKAPDTGVLVDVALDPFTDHGHDGIVINEIVDNDATLDILAKQALNYASAGADIIAPSDMMDGRVKTIRQALDQAGYTHTMIMSYAAKYASALYAPFRGAVNATRLTRPADKKTYQMEPANTDEAMREIALDIAEGADFVMVKPGMPYLDVVRRAADTFNVPLFAYQVSGEYVMIQSLMEGLDETRQHDLVMEMLIAFKRAGCRAVLSYFARDIAHRLHKP